MSPDDPFVPPGSTETVPSGQQVAPSSSPTWPASPRAGLPQSAYAQVGESTYPSVMTLPSEVGTGQMPITVNNADVVAGSVAKMIFENRKRDLLEGRVLPRDRITRSPVVRSGQWGEVWRQALAPDTARLRQRVLIIVAPRSFGSTTLALHLLAETTDHRTRIVKLDADWSTPKVGRLPLEDRHAYQIDLKESDTDRVSTDFLHGLEHHATQLEAQDSYLVLTVAKDLWNDFYAPAHADIHVVHLRQPPPAREVVETHLRARKAPGLVPYLDTVDAAKFSLNGLDAVEAVRAADTVMLTWEEHVRVTGSALPVDDPSRTAVDADLAARITDALSDWRDKLDLLFGETTTVHRGKDESLPLEDRCLLLALAVRQSAPMCRCFVKTDPRVVSEF